MKRIDRWSLARSAAEAWKQAYYDEQKQRWYPPEQVGIYKQLVALGPIPQPEDVDAIIGNPTWTHPQKCGECDKAFDELVQIGEPVEYESRTAWICRGCLIKALMLLDE